jgi:Family of unknown function (DUF5996)
VRTSRAELDSFQLTDGLSVAALHERLFAIFTEFDIQVDINAEPYGVPETTPFTEDTEHASYDREAVERFWQALRWVDWTFQEFAGWFCGKTSPVHLLWHGFDLAVTRFSSARAPENRNADLVTREAYSHELISFGFWPGDQKVREPMFYSYTAPEPAGLAEQRLRPGAASWQQPFGQGHLALLPYEALRTSNEPARGPSRVSAERLRGRRHTRRLGSRSAPLDLVPTVLQSARRLNSPDPSDRGRAVGR